MSALWTHKTAKSATKGKAVKTWEVSGLSIDTRSLQAGDLFIPLKDCRDGHDFIPMAYEKGAAAVLSERPIKDVPALIVNNVMSALRDLAIASRKRSVAKRIAVTGSVGKTSVKEMLAHIACEQGKTHASIKSYNNHWGVPYTLAGMTPDTQYGVFEMGMNHAGELAELTQIVRPNIAVITNVAPAHLAHFENVNAIANAKAEILGGLVENGIAVLPRDSRYYDMLARHAKQVASFGWHKDADARIMETRLTAQGSHSVVNLAGRPYHVHLPLVGKHWVENAACALLVSYHAGLKLETALNSLKNMRKLSGRGEIKTLSIHGNSITLIDESYNANPASMSAAVSSLGLYEGRKIAVLGDMLELGTDEQILHENLNEDLKNAHIDKVLCCGFRMQALHDVLSESMRGGWFEDADTCQLALEHILLNDDTIMVKGSHASGMGRLVSALSKRGNTTRDTQNVL